MDSIGAATFLILDGALPGLARGLERSSRVFEEGDMWRRTGRHAKSGILHGLFIVATFGEVQALEQSTYPALVGTLVTLTRQGSTIANVIIEDVDVHFEFRSSILAPTMVPAWTPGTDGYYVHSDWRLCLAGAPP